LAKIIAHRGASSTHTENTLEAFRAAGEVGADGIELDVRLSGDDVLVVHHDAHLADGRAIRDLVLADLPDHVPTLAQALEAAGDLWINVEIKNLQGEPDYDDRHQISVAVAGLLAAHLAVTAPLDGAPGSDGATESDGASGSGRILVSSFNVDSMHRIRETEVNLPLGLLVWGQADPASLVARTAAHGFQAINPHDILVDRAFVDRAHEAGLEVNVWTVDDPARMEQLNDFGVDGIITNDPAQALRVLGRDPGLS
jgi:glycerophosphoryl diester phosphodiesterase